MSALMCFALIGIILLAGCGQNANAAGCMGNVATVGGVSIPQAQYRLLLRYSLRFYERGNPDSHYFGKKICHSKKFRKQCADVKRSLLHRMIDQQIVSNYAAAHNLLPTSSDWASALNKEGKIVRNAGGHSAFGAFLRKVGTDQARFRWIESEEIETAKVIQAIGADRFRSWLHHRHSVVRITRCTLR